MAELEFKRSPAIGRQLVQATNGLACPTNERAKERTNATRPFRPDTTTRRFGGDFKR